MDQQHSTERMSKILTRLPHELHQQLLAESHRRGVSLNLLCCEYLRSGLSKTIESDGQK